MPPDLKLFVHFFLLTLYGPLLDWIWYLTQVNQNGGFGCILVPTNFKTILSGLCFYFIGTQNKSPCKILVPKYGPKIWSQKVVPTSFKIVPSGLCFCFNGAQKESTCTSKYSWKKFNLFPESPEGLLKLSLTSWNALSKFASAELLLLL